MRSVGGVEWVDKQCVCEFNYRVEWVIIIAFSAILNVSGRQEKETQDPFNHDIRTINTHESVCVCRWIEWSYIK